MQQRPGCNESAVPVYMNIAGDKHYQRAACILGHITFAYLVSKW